MQVTKEALNLVWLKRDLRTQDHLPLAEAEKAGIPYLVVFVFEPSLLAYPDCAERHLRFQMQSLHDMQNKWEAIGRKPVLFYGEVLAVFDWICKHFNIKQVFSYQESGIEKTFQRDLLLAKFFKENGVLWREFQRNGVVRGIQNRQQWDQKWHGYMAEPLVQNSYQASLIPVESQQLAYKHPFPIPESILKLKEHSSALMQAGGEDMAWQYFNGFLTERYSGYQTHISKPMLSRKSCSRLSPFIAWGNLSIRQVYQTTKKIQLQVHNKRALQAFLTRVKWHDHFVQKFEQCCTYEYKPINKAFEALAASNSQEKLLAWKHGNTGIPLVDANMRALIHTGWINFRMRALLVSFLTHHLDIDWRLGVYHMALQFLDYEPGIHYTQFQMQAGTTGVNILRVYNPVKNAMEHDADGAFIRKWVPEIATLPNNLLFQPWQMTAIESTMYQVELGKTYPIPIIQLQGKNKDMVTKIYAIKKSAEAQNEGKIIVSKLVRNRKKK